MSVHVLSKALILYC